MKLIRSACFLLVISLLTACQPESPETSKEIDALSTIGLKRGEDYLVLKKPLPVDTHSRVQVTEFFWYGCGHCYHVEQPLKQWLARKPGDVHFEKVPAMWKESMYLHARAFFIAKRLAQPGMLDGLFPTILELRKNTDMAEHKRALQRYFARYHINEQEFEALWNDEAILAQVAQADEWQKQAKISGTPAIVINGKYLINNPRLHNVTDIVPLADKMVKALRAIPVETNNGDESAVSH